MHSLAAASAASAAAATTSTRSCASIASTAPSSVGQVVWRAAPLPTTTACRRRRQHQPVQALGGMEAVQLASGLISTGLLGAIAWTIMQQPEAQVEDQETSCPRCAGSGYEPCVCRKWSDSDVGCGGCSQSGYMRCRSCGGRGKAIRMLNPIKMEANNSRSPY